MKYIISITNEQAQYLYIFISGLSLDKVKNRERWKFLKVIEDTVIDYEKGLNALKSEKEDVDAKFRILRDKKIEFTFNDREAYEQVKVMFSTMNNNELEGRNSKLYDEIDDIFSQTVGIK